MRPAPEKSTLRGFEIATFIPVMILLLVPGVLLTTMGGQLTLMVVDCLEGIISLIFYLCIAVALMWMPLPACSIAIEAVRAFTPPLAAA